MSEKTLSLLKNMPGIRSFIKTDAWKSVRYALTLRFSDRKNETYTQFLRLPSQFDALSGPVLDHLFSGGMNTSLKIGIVGCSYGAESYSIASVLTMRHPNLNFTIHAYDISRDMIERAKKAWYSQEEVHDNKFITDAFLDMTFDRDRNRYKVKKAIIEKVHFNLGDALDPNLERIVGTSDIVFAQNFLFHMKPRTATKAFHNICRLLNSRAALFIDGIDLDVREHLTRASKLSPLDYKIEEIHNEARRARGAGWPYSYWGLEPFQGSRKDWRRRYATIFMKM